MIMEKLGQTRSKAAYQGNAVSPRICRSVRHVSVRQRGGYVTGPHRPILFPLSSNLGANQHSTMQKEKDREGHSKQCKHGIRDSKHEFAFKQVGESRPQI